MKKRLPPAADLNERLPLAAVGAGAGEGPVIPSESEGSGWGAVGLAPPAAEAREGHAPLAPVQPSEAKLTLAAFLRCRHPELSWSAAKQLCFDGQVRVDGVSEIDPARRLLARQRVALNKQGAEGSAKDDGIRYLDADVVVVVKPAGVLTVPFEDGDRDTMLHRAAVAVRRREKPRKAAGSGRNPTLRAVQRLDKETSGLLVFARTIPAQRALQEELKEAKIDRVYRAVVLGHFTGERRFESWLIADRGDGRRGSWRPPRGSTFGVPTAAPPAGSRHAVTHAKALRGTKVGKLEATVLECRLETGRTHQIRIHLAEAGHPVLGDAVYGRGTVAAEASNRLLLHAERLAFRHPRTGDRMSFEEPPPAGFPG